MFLLCSFQMLCLGNDQMDRQATEKAKHQICCALRAASQSNPPSMTKAAQRLLQAYYTYIRNPGDFNEYTPARTVPVHIFNSLIRLATASAKLTLSPIIRPVPDVTLAIKIIEETLLEMVMEKLPVRR